MIYMLAKLMKFTIIELYGTKDVCNTFLYVLLLADFIKIH